MAAAELHKATGATQLQQKPAAVVGDNADDDRGTAAAAAAVSSLLSAVGASSVDAAVSQYQGMRQRLQRLDQVG